MIAGMCPVRDPESYLFCTLPPETLSAAVIAQACALFREDEGVSLIVACAAARAMGVPDTPPYFARITLMVHSALEGVGLSAAVAGALAEADIPCNMVAAFHHDHLFVPIDQAENAMQVLEALQRAHQD